MEERSEMGWRSQVESSYTSLTSLLLGSRSTRSLSSLHGLGLLLFSAARSRGFGSIARSVMDSCRCSDWLFDDPARTPKDPLRLVWVDCWGQTRRFRSWLDRDHFRLVMMELAFPSTFVNPTGPITQFHLSLLIPSSFRSIQVPRPCPSRRIQQNSQITFPSCPNRA
jgi:hypothetical protein